ncbi:rubrerythrin family protein [archaeon]|jgi:rubrerythrin|nr:rubrerythrin family protein [archaeon]MBT6868949.1 rubrerythrin family protein [archaeon]MBT7192830.1 rubrerythrin family protein [archaeon]MBT7380796.1 rubrerythrin family protein [archaeon]MBT7507551.1 rubrerythrin family protein [archaeon]
MTTAENLMAAFAGESQARNKYDYFAKQARKEGLIMIAKIFEETAINEMQHAKDELKLLDGIKSTKENLKEAITGEDYETTSMYPKFAEEAKAEGNEAAAKLFTEISKVEREHRERFRKLLQMIEEGTIFKRDKPIRWKCGKCGYIHYGTEAPEECPTCKHPQSYYEPECMCFGENCDKCC